MDSIISKTLSNITKVVPMIYVISLISFILSWFIPITNLALFNILPNASSKMLFSFSIFSAPTFICLAFLTFFSGKIGKKSDYTHSNFKPLLNTFYLFWHFSAEVLLLYPLLSGITPYRILIDSLVQPQFWLPLFLHFLISIFLVLELYFGVIAQSDRFLSWVNASSSSHFE